LFTFSSDLVEYHGLVMAAWAANRLTVPVCLRYKNPRINTLTFISALKTLSSVQKRKIGICFFFMRGVWVFVAVEFVETASSLRYFLWQKNKQLSNGFACRYLHIYPSTHPFSEKLSL